MPFVLHHRHILLARRPDVTVFQYARFYPLFWLSLLIVAFIQDRPTDVARGTAPGRLIEVNDTACGPCRFARTYVRVLSVGIKSLLIIARQVHPWAAMPSVHLPPLSLH